MNIGDIALQMVGIDCPGQGKAGYVVRRRKKSKLREREGKEWVKNHGWRREGGGATDCEELQIDE